MKIHPMEAMTKPIATSHNFTGVTKNETNVCPVFVPVNSTNHKIPEKKVTKMLVRLNKTGRE